MLTAIERARLSVVLVGARNPANIGAAARAMRDFGFSDLRIVNEYAAPFEAAQLEAMQAVPKSAVGAASVMHKAQRFTNLAAAVADCTLIAGTTAIGERDLQRDVLPIRQATASILAALADSQPAGPSSASEAGAPRVALLFGSEKTGLTNTQLSHCSLLLTIPMFDPGAVAGEGPGRHLSMNLGQSVAVCLYELVRAGFEGSKLLPALREASATGDDRERLTQLLLDVMHATGYARRFPANAAEPLVRQLAGQLGATHREAMTWMGILRQVLWREQQINQQ